MFPVSTAIIMYAELNSSFGQNKGSEGQENTLNTPGHGIAASASVHRPRVSPSSSKGSLSTLNPHAKVNSIISYVFLF